jgi:hypothetical protein
MNISKEDARELICGDLEGWETIESDIVDTSRWSNCYRGIFKSPDGKHYSLEWSEGATEQQDESPFDYDEPELVEVKAVPTMVIKWEQK